MEPSSLMLSASRALWGIITPNVRKVSVDVKKNVICIHFYYNNDPNETEIELSEEAATEIIADFPEPFLIECERKVFSFPEYVKVEGYLIYSRYEPNPEEDSL